MNPPLTNPAHLQDRIHRRGGPGTRPGTLHIDPDALMSSIGVMAYNPDGVTEEDVSEVSELKAFLDQYPVVWVNITGLGDGDVLRKIADLFQLHRLALEDIVNVPQRPKADLYDQHMLIIMRMIECVPELVSEQVSIFVGRNFVVSFQEKPGDCFDGVRERIRDGRGRIRHAGPDYLAYALLDAIIDIYYSSLESYGERLDALQDEVIRNPQNELILRIHEIKRELLAVRRAAWPTRDLLNTLIHDEDRIFTAETRVYLRDCYDHIAQVVDLLENYREVAAGLMDVYLNSVSNRMNEVMKVLTIIATIFIPLSFIAGLYGMNFNPENSPLNMPELSWYFGYPFAIGLMLAMAGGMLLFFRRKRWL